VRAAALPRANVWYHSGASTRRRSSVVSIGAHPMSAKPFPPFDPAREEAELRAYLGDAYDHARLMLYERQLQDELARIGDEQAFYRASEGYLYDLTAFAMTGTKQPYLRELVRAVPPGAHLLDWGCGIGSDGLALLEAGYRVAFADFANPSTRYLRWRLERRGLDAPVYDLDVDAIRAAGIPAANNPGFNSSSVAEHTIMLMLVVLHRFVAAHAATRSGGFPTPGFVLANQPHLRELGDETVGLIGLGSIGRAVAERLQGFKTRVLYFARHRADQATEAQLGVEYTAFNDLLADASIVSLHVPSSAETRHLIGPTQLALMQPNSFLINTSRGDLVDEAALRRALQDGRLAGAALDVLEDEVSETNPFADLPQVVVTPHSAGISRTSMPRALRLAAANIDRFLCGEPVVNLVTM